MIDPNVGDNAVSSQSDPRLPWLLPSSSEAAPALFAVLVQHLHLQKASKPCPRQGVADVPGVTEGVRGFSNNNVPPPPLDAGAVVSALARSTMEARLFFVCSALQKTINQCCSRARSQPRQEYRTRFVPRETGPVLGWGWLGR